MASERYVRKAGARLLSGLALAGLLFASPARAEPSSADKDTARALLKEGDEKFASHDFSGALKAYQAANAIMQVPTTALPLARAQIERGMLVEARDTLLQITRFPREAKEPEAYGKARDEAGPLAQKLSDRIPSIAITVEGPPSGAAVEVTVDGAVVPAGALGTPRKVNPGGHTITGAAAGFKSFSKSLALKEGDSEKFTIKLVPGEGGAILPAKAADVKGGGRIHVQSLKEPGNVFVDGKAVGATPLDVPVPSGLHKVEVQYAGGSSDERRVDVAAGATVEVEAQPSAMDAVGRSRKGVRFGFSIAPIMAVELDGNAPLFGGAASALLNIGITPTFDFRTGVTAGFLHRGNDKDTASQITAVVPVMLRVNWNPWFSAAAGLSLGFGAYLSPGDSTQLGFSIGPEWSALSMSAGDKRQYELSVTQGLRFGDTPREYHQGVTFTYLFLD